MQGNTELACVCRCFTTFSPRGDVDTNAFAAYLRRFQDSAIDVYVASSGTGAGQALTRDELVRVYEAAVTACRGRIAVGANVPEQFTSGQMLDQVRLAIDCGVDIVNIYGPDGRHSYRPTELEYQKYFDKILAKISHPVALSPLPSSGYTPRAEALAAICNAYDQVTTVVLTSVDDTYFIRLMDSLQRQVRVLCAEAGSANTLKMGAAGLCGNLAGVIPKTYRRYLDLISCDRVQDAAEPYRDIRKLQAVFTSQRWSGGSPRRHQMYLDGFSQPGANGLLPDPFVNPKAEEREEFIAQIKSLNVAELREQARVAFSCSGEGL